MAKQILKMILNGQEIEQLVDSRTLLVHFLREQMNLTGAHIGCETSQCGACTVDIDGESVKACTHLAVQCDGCDVITVEGLAEGGALHAVQEAFYEEHGLQCGYCTPGMLMRSYRFLQENPSPSEAEIREGLSGNLCRCTGYQNIIKAVKSAAAKLQNKEKTEA